MISELPILSHGINIIFYCLTLLYMYLCVFSDAVILIHQGEDVGKGSYLKKVNCKCLHCSMCGDFNP